MLRSRTCFCILCAAIGAALTFIYLGLARTPTASARQKQPKAVSFIDDVAPIFKESCFGCHGAKNPKGKLDMTHYASLRKGGTKDDPIAPGQPDDSYLLTVLKATGKMRMPPKESGDPLPKEKVAVIERWVREGARL